MSDSPYSQHLLPTVLSCLDSESCLTKHLCELYGGGGWLSLGQGRPEQQHLTQSLLVPLVIPTV